MIHCVHELSDRVPMNICVKCDDKRDWKAYDKGFTDGVKAERERCIKIIYGQCSSDNEAYRIVKAIKNDGPKS